MMDHQIRDRIHKNQKVRLLVKKKEGKYDPEHGEYDKMHPVPGIVTEVVTKTSEHYRGIKVHALVRAENIPGMVPDTTGVCEIEGRVCEIL